MSFPKSLKRVCMPLTEASNSVACSVSQNGLGKATSFTSRYKDIYLKVKKPVKIKYKIYYRVNKERIYIYKFKNYLKA